MVLLTAQVQVTQLQRDLSESGMREKLETMHEEHGRMLHAELANHAAALDATKVSAAPRLMGQQMLQLPWQLQRLPFGVLPRMLSGCFRLPGALPYCSSIFTGQLSAEQEQPYARGRVGQHFLTHRGWPGP